VILDLPLLVSILWTQSISLLLFGFDTTREFAQLIELSYANRNSFELIGLLLLFTESVFFLYISSKLVLHQRVILLGSFFFLIILSIMGGRGSESDKFLLISTGNGARYFYAPNVVLMFVILANIEWRGDVLDKIRSGLFTILLATALILGIVQYQKFIGFSDEGPRWTEEVLRWQEDQTYKIKIWPSGWQIELTQSPP